MDSQLSADVVQMLADLGVLVSSGRLKQTDIQAHTGVHQSQISRILAGKAKRPSRNVEVLCKYARCVANTEERSPAVELRMLQEAVVKIWNGTDRHAQAIRDVLQALDRLQNCTAQME